MDGHGDPFNRAAWRAFEQQQLASISYPFQPHTGGLDPRFKVQSKGFFQVGKVFRVLWAEPAGDWARENLSNAARVLVPGKYGQMIYQSTKYFVVIERKDPYCLVLRIDSHTKRGVGAPAAINAEHAVIYTGENPPTPFPDELPRRGKAGLLQETIRVVPDSDNAKGLELSSRLNFGKVYTMEHNIPAHSRGSVHPDSMDDFKRLFREIHQRSLGDGHMSHNQGSSEVVETGSGLCQLPPDAAPSQPLSLAIPIYKVLSGTPGDREEFNHAFREQESAFFKEGKVFRIADWAEQPSWANVAMDEDSVSSAVTGEVTRHSRAGEIEITQCLWLVVIKSDARSCLCLRIRSYEGRGVPEECSKSEHSMVYTGKDLPKPSKSESNAQQRFRLPVRIKRTDRGTKLRPTHRLRYSTVYRVFYDVKACEFGEVHPSQVWTLKYLAQEYFLTRMDTTVSPATPQHQLELDLCKSAVQELNPAELSGDEELESEWDMVTEASDEDDEIMPDIPARRFIDGERVLLPHKSNPSARAKFKPLRIKEAQLVPVRRMWEWEYRLVHERHDGDFDQGQFFSEDRLMSS